MNQDHVSVWAQCLDVIKDNISAQAFKTWFVPIKPVKLDGQVLTIQVLSVLLRMARRALRVLAAQNGKKIHFLGMVDGPNEISLVRDFHIDTWDSSAGVWAGLNGISFDNSPTGLINGKFEKHVDFSADLSDNLDIAKKNINYINELVARYNNTERL